jgi:asparagine synthetase B (glutamine-hydrolysing)
VSETLDLDPLEIASSIVFGQQRDVTPPSSDGASPRAALESSLLEALTEAPCLVSFSGGRDSSGLLALAVHVARRAGLPDPIPITARYPGTDSAEETSWQELSIRHLKIDDWVVKRFGNEVDLVGPIATELMTRRGLPYPYNLHLQAPLVQEARGGTFVTGLGGDEAFMPASRALGVLTGAARPRPRDVLVVGAAVAPRPVRRAWLTRTQRLAFPWLRAAANDELTRRAIEEALRQPLRWDGALREWWRTRYLQLTMANITQLGEDAGVRMRHPFADPTVVGALARAGGMRGFASRTSGLATLFGDVLPPEVPKRSDKATFDAVLWSTHSRLFVEESLRDERGLEAALEGAELLEWVDPRLLLAHWSGGVPAANSFLVLQACRLAWRDAAPASG